MSRTYAREVVLKSIFQIDFHIEKESFLNYLDKYELKPDDYEYAKDSIENILNFRDSIDNTIDQYLINWDITRINKVELAILRLAAYEILYKKDIPVPVSINEAINLVNKYSEPKSIKYINAVLEKIAKNNSSSGDNNED